MDGYDFDRIARLLAGAPTRRSALRLLAGAAGALLGRADPAAAGNCAKAGERCGPHATCCGSARCLEGRCRRQCPPERRCGGDECCGPCAKCEGGRCQPAVIPICANCEHPECEPATGEFVCLTRCTAAQSCCNGRCVGSCGGCAGKTTRCRGTQEFVCVDLKTSHEHCGNCDLAACSTQETCCDGTCVDTKDNWQHCGRCGKVCDIQESCCNGRCMPVCEGGLDPDPTNGCRCPCPPIRVCPNGQCCPERKMACQGIGLTGCTCCDEKTEGCASDGGTGAVCAPACNPTCPS